MRGVGDDAGAERDHAVIHLLHQQAVQINEVAGHIDFGDLPPSVAQRGVARGEPFQQQDAVVGDGMLQHDIDIGVDLARQVEDLGQGGDFDGRNRVPARQFFNEGVGHGVGPIASKRETPKPVKRCRSP
ncbi:hypothetical protein D3C80_1247290 [compost metagenome]